MCKQCELKPVYKFTNKRKLCKNCFIKYFQKKVLYTIRKFKLIQKNDIVYYENKNDFRSVVLEDVLKMFSEKSMIEVIKLCSPQARNINEKQLIEKTIGGVSLINSNKSRAKRGKLAIPLTIDLVSNQIIHKLIKGHVGDLKQVSPINGKIISPLYLFLDEEVLLYSKLKRLKFTKKVEKKDKIEKFIDELEKKHPEVKRAVVKGFLGL